jgi:hypothetical protein
MTKLGHVADRAQFIATGQNPSRHAKFYFWLFIAGFFTFVLHEAAHWLVGTALGYDMQMRLNAVTAATVVLPNHKAMIDAAGPLVTIFQAVVAFAIVIRYRANTAFVFLYMAAFMRVLATAISFLNPNDEARLSVYLGLGTWTLPLVVSNSLLLLVWSASRRLQLTWKEQLFCYLIASASVSLVVGADRFLF